MPTNRFVPLSDVERAHLCSFIDFWARIARDGKHPMRRMARTEVAHLLWRWTADGVDIRTGAVVQDAFKYDVEFHPATSEAIGLRSIGRRRELRHEHVVPRMVLANHIITANLDPAGIGELLRKFCLAVIVTAAEDDRILPRSRMPPGWTWDTGSPFARYVDSGLIGEVQNLPLRSDFARVSWGDGPLSSAAVALQDPQADEAAHLAIASEIVKSLYGQYRQRICAFGDAITIVPTET